MEGNGQLTLFDYDAVRPDLAARLRERAERIARREAGVRQAILDNGRDFAEARVELRHNKAGGFEGWVGHHGWSRAAAYNYIAAWEHFGNCPTVGQLMIDAKALYALAAPSTPEEAREEAIARAEDGEQITHAKAQEIIEEHCSSDDLPADELPPPPPPQRHPHSDRLARWLKEVTAQ